MGLVSPKTLLLDTNVWLSYYLGSRTDSDLARRLLNLAVENDAQLAYAVTTAKDLFFLLSADCKRAYKTERGQLTETAAAAANELAWGCVRHLSELAIAVPCDYTDVWMAQKQRPLTRPCFFTLPWRPSIWPMPSSTSRTWHRGETLASRRAAY